MLYYICSVVHKSCFVLFYSASCSPTRPEAQRSHFSRQNKRGHFTQLRPKLRGKVTPRSNKIASFPLLNTSFLHSAEETTRIGDKRRLSFLSHVLVCVILSDPRMSVITISYFMCRNTPGCHVSISNLVHTWLFYTGFLGAIVNKAVRFGKKKAVFPPSAGRLRDPDSPLTFRGLHRSVSRQV